MSDTSVKTVPSEVWARIITFLGREQEWVTDWRDDEIHQQDLSVAMRVNSTFHRLAAPVLYSKVVTDDIDLLFMGLEIRTSSIIASPSSRLLSKAQLLAKTTHINFVTPHRHFVMLYRDLLAGNVWAQDERVLHHQEDTKQTQLREIYSGITRTSQHWINKLGKSSTTRSVLPMLQTATFGTGYPALWELVFVPTRVSNEVRRMRPMDIIILRGDANRTFKILLFLLRPLYLCQRSTWAPGAIVRGSIDDVRHASMVNHIHLHHTEGITWFSGIRNVIFCPVWDGIVATDVNLDILAALEDWLLTFLRDLVSRFDGGSVSPGSMMYTTIEVYGLFRGYCENGVKEEELRVQHEEEVLLDKHTDSLLGYVENVNLRSRISLRLRKDRPVCPGCEGKADIIKYHRER